MRQSIYCAAYKYAYNITIASKSCFLLYYHKSMLMVVWGLTEVRTEGQENGKEEPCVDTLC